MRARHPNLHRTVTHSRAALGYAMAILTLTTGIAMATDDLTIEKRKELLLKSHRHARDIDLADDRRVCAFHRMPNVVKAVEADGSPHPGTVPMCKAIITESLKRDNGIHLYTNFAVTEMTGADVFTIDLDVSKIVTKDEDLNTYRSIRDAAMADRTTYKTVRERELPLSTALAIDAGAFAGYRQPDARIAPSQSDADIERTTGQCYEQNSDFSRKACFLAGARFGQSVRRTLDAASADPPGAKAPNTPPAHKSALPTAPAR